jgi:hypothetical protein
MSSPGCSVFKVVCSSLKASVSDAAAKTVAGPDTCCVCAPPDELALAADVAVLLSELHAASANAVASTSTDRTRNRRNSEPPRPHEWSQDPSWDLPA